MGLQSLIDALKCFGPLIFGMAFIFWILNRLDTRWRADVRSRQQGNDTNDHIPAIRCWNMINCSSDRRQGCPAYQNQNIPCWQHFRSSDGYLHKSCLSCDVFLKAPVPNT